MRGISWRSTTWKRSWGSTSIEVGHVVAAYDESGWRSPIDPDNSLRKTSCQKRWLDTSDMKAIKVLIAGRNVIQHDMPVKRVKKLRLTSSTRRPPGDSPGALAARKVCA